MPRALSFNEVLKKKFILLALEGQWQDMLGQVEDRGVWFIWGDSGNGKTAFLLQMMKEVSRFGPVVFDSLEMGSGFSMQEAIRKAHMEDVFDKLQLVTEPMEDLDLRLCKRKAPKFAFIDSVQYLNLNFKQYLAFKERHRDKVLVFVSQSKGSNPMGMVAEKIMFDADIKIYVEGFNAYCKGRAIGPNGGYYTIWQEGANEYHGQQNI